MYLNPDLIISMRVNKGKKKTNKTVIIFSMLIAYLGILFILGKGCSQP